MTATNTITLTADQAAQLKGIDLTTAKLSDLVSLYNGVTGAALKGFKNRTDATEHLTPLINAANGTVQTAEEGIGAATTATTQVDGRGRNNRGKKYEKNPVQRQEESVRSFLKEGETRSEIFTHSQLAKMTDCSWMSSVTLISALRCDYGMLIARVAKVPVNREGVPVAQQPPAHMTEENGFIFFSKGEADYNVYMEAVNKEKAAAKAAEKLAKDKIKAEAKRKADAEKEAKRKEAEAAAKVTAAETAKAQAEAAQAEAAKAAQAAGTDTAASPSDAQPAADA